MNGPVLLVEQLSEATSLVTLNRPDRRNALSIGLMEALCGAISGLATQSERRVVILQGAGPAFCSGMDLREAAEPGVAERTAPWIARTLEALATSPLVTIAAVHGAAYAGGGGLMACCDFIVAAEGTKIGFPEVRRGLLSALITPVLRSRLRDGDLRELLLLGDPIDARRAMQMGLVGRVVPPERLLDEAKARRCAKPSACCASLIRPTSVVSLPGRWNSTSKAAVARKPAKASVRFANTARRAGPTFPLPPGEG
jgi:methylglutaconyl-CoA hydratase